MVTKRFFDLAVAAVLLSISGPAAAQSAGAVRGTVYDREFVIPLEGVRVTVVETQRTGITTGDGAFLLDGLEPGSYTLTFAALGYERQVVSGVLVTAAGIADLERVEMSAELVEMDELLVTGSDLLAGGELEALELRATSLIVQDNLSQELIGKAGASDVAGALPLVVGTSVREGKYATVRGLSDRYTGTTLNGVRVPSADPRRRAVQVDIFPTGTIESVSVSKTFTPDLQGDFTGGGVDIRTKSVPEKFQFSFSISREWDSSASGNDRFLTYEGAGIEPTGNAGSDRDFPDEARAGLPAIPNFNQNPTPSQMADAEAYDRVVRAFQPTMGTTRDSVDWNGGYSLVAGDRFEVGDVVIGALGALSYSRKKDFYDQGVTNTGVVRGPDQPISYTHARTEGKGTDELLIGILGKVVVQFAPKQEISLEAILNQGAEDAARLQVRRDSPAQTEQNQSLQYTERSVRSYQLHGSHGLPRKLEIGEPEDTPSIGWFAAHNTTSQEEPDVRYFRNLNAYDANTQTNSSEMPGNSTESERTRRIFREIEEDNDQIGADFSLPFSQWTQTSGKIKLGARTDRTDRSYEQDSFRYEFPTQFLQNINAATKANRDTARYSGTGPESLEQYVAVGPSELWTDVFTNPDRIGLAPNRCAPGQLVTSTSNCSARNQLLWVLGPTGQDVDYEADQTIDGYYAMAELPLSPAVDLVLGARLESTRLMITPTTASGLVDVIEVQPSGDRALVKVPQAESAADIRQEDLLPSAGVVWDILPDVMKLRGSWSKTIARPTFRELAPLATEEFLFGDEFIGNPDLTLSSITNYDVRWEWFPRPGEVLAVSGFYKDLEQPIEMISFGAAGHAYIQPVNFERGKVSGFELEAKIVLERLSPKLAGLTVGTNYTRLDTEVDVPLSEQQALANYDLDQPTRRLQGQPAYLFNFNVTYENDESGTSASLFYNRSGDTLIAGGATNAEDGSPDVFEESLAVLDLAVRQEFKLESRPKGPRFALQLRGKNLTQPDRRTVYRIPSGDEALKAERETAVRISLTGSVSW